MIPQVSEIKTHEDYLQETNELMMIFKTGLIKIVEIVHDWCH
jgi:hypothetical protein